MADLFDRLLVACPNGGGLFYLRKGSPLKLDGLDTTGLTVRGSSIARAVQPSQLTLMSAHTRDVDGTVARMDDLHDAYLDSDSCFVVSTHGNEIVEFDLDGVQRARWAFPGEPDAWHINCVARWNGRIVFSAFADRRQHRAYKQPPLDEGFVQDLQTGARPISGLFQPHSLVTDGDRLVLANSGAFELREYAADGELLRHVKLDGYTRGVLRAGKVTYVGLSKTRNVDVAGLQSAMLVALDARTWKELGRIALPVDEIYSVQALPVAAAPDVVVRLAAHANMRVSAELVSGAAARDDLARQVEAGRRTATEVQRESERKIFGLLETVHGKDLEIQNRDEIVRGKDAEIVRRDALLEDKDTQLAAVGEQLREKDRQVFGLLETVHGKDLEIQNRDEIVRGKDAEIARRDALLQDKEADLAALAARQEENDRQIFGLLEAVHGKDLELAHRAELVRSARAAADEQRRIVAEDRARIDSLAAAIATSNAAIQQQAARLADAQDRLGTQARELAVRDDAILNLQRTLSWRLTKPLRAAHQGASWLLRARWMAPIARPFNKLRHMYGTVRRTLGDPASRMRYVTLARVLGPRLAVKHTVAYLRRGGPRPRQPIPVPVFDIREGHQRRAVILTTLHCDFVAASIQHALARVGVPATIIHERPAAGYEDVPHFVICPQMFEHLPGLYVAFQMEQSVSTRWFTPDYVRKLENSFAIFDYSVANIDALVAKGLTRKQFFYMPLGYLPDYAPVAPTHTEEYDVVFYGDINNDRRRAFVAALEKVCRVKVLFNVFCDELRNELAKAKLVVNIHYYEGALLETTRLWECISMGKLVVSERAANMAENEDLESLVDFVDVNDIDGMVARVRFWLEHPDQRLARVTANDEAARRQPNRFEYFFYRFMLAFDNLSFFRFWQLAGSKLQLAGDRWCLNLPEYTHRRASFDQDNHYGFVIFPGLRHSQGWIGCGLSYKLMIMLAGRQKLRQVTICEDDVEFRSGFAQDFETVSGHLADCAHNWNVFSGLLGDLHADAAVSAVVEVGTYKLAATNRLISTVFNIYNRGVFRRVALWDDTDRDVNHNTIDRYLEATRLKVVACFPFLVGHKPELDSTLWGVQNDSMTKMIQSSERRLGRKIQEFVVHEKFCG